MEQNILRNVERKVSVQLFQGRKFSNLSLLFRKDVLISFERLYLLSEEILVLRVHLSHRLCLECQ